mmetsp:Transcript_42458/g.68293  ORF Transcript_42458/g.68293 Transcript_42458/m.68293 type:complete len:641 (+) Transcript_42458:265-2187(+)
MRILKTTAVRWWVVFSIFISFGTLFSMLSAYPRDFIASTLTKAEYSNYFAPEAGQSVLKASESTSKNKEDVDKIAEEHFPAAGEDVSEPITLQIVGLNGAADESESISEGIESHEDLDKSPDEPVPATHENTDESVTVQNDNTQSIELNGLADERVNSTTPIEPISEAIESKVADESDTDVNVWVTGEVEAHPEVEGAERVPTNKPTGSTTATEAHAEYSARLTAIERERIHEDQVADAKCSSSTSKQLLEKWGSSKRLVCRTDKGEVVHEYVLYDWEYHPNVLVFENVVVKNPDVSFTIQTGCDRRNTYVTGEQRPIVPDWAGNLNENMPIQVEPRTFYAVNRFDLHNPYEGQHAYLNAYITFRMLGYDAYLTKLEVTPVFLDKLGHSKYDDDMWSLLFNHAPIGSSNNFSKPPTLARVLKIVRAQSTGTSILTTTVAGSLLRGREIDHHCKSRLVGEYATFIRQRLLGLREQSLMRNIDGGVINVIWSSRAPYIRKGKRYAPSRHIRDEDQLLGFLRDRLGPQFNITVVNFGQISLKESIELMVGADVFVGTHGAALVHSLFLEPHSVLIEMFGCDRAPTNRHYHNIASLVDVQYKHLEGMSCIREEITFSQKSQEKLLSMIQTSAKESRLQALKRLR